MKNFRSFIRVFWLFILIQILSTILVKANSSVCDDIVYMALSRFGSIHLNNESLEIDDFESQDSVINPVVESEASIINDIVENGIGERLILSDFKATNSGSSSITLTSRSGRIQFVMEKSSDVIPFPNTFENPNATIDIMGDGSIHRFNGYVKFDNGFTFIGTGNVDNRLTFLLIKNVGYVYIRGEGKIIYPDGNTVFYKQSED